MKNIKKILLALSGLLLILQLGCDAPRNNPLDPLNKNNNLAILEGTVKSISFPNNPIKNVEVFWQNGNSLIYTDDNGIFRFDNVERENGWLFFSSSVFVDDSIFIAWSGEKNKQVQMLLNAKPHLDSLQLYSIVQNRFQFTQIYEMVVAANITDTDGANDIDSVFVNSKLFTVPVNLEYNAATNFYEERFSLSDIGINSLDEVIGVNFNITVKDLEGRMFEIGSSIVKRVIRDEIELITPSNNELATQPLLLNWKRFTPGFDFNYLLQIYTNQNPAELVWQQENVESDLISFEVDSTLEAGDYFWVVWAIDEFLNRSRSKPATFRIN